MSSEHVMLRAEGVGKRYRIGAREPYKALRDVIAEASLTRRCAAPAAGPGRRSSTSGRSRTSRSTSSGARCSA